MAYFGPSEIETSLTVRLITKEKAHERMNVEDD